MAPALVATLAFATADRRPEQPLPLLATAFVSSQLQVRPCPLCVLPCHTTLGSTSTYTCVDSAWLHALWVLSTSGQSCFNHSYDG